MIHKRQARAKTIFENSNFNCYYGPEKASTVVIASGPPVLYVREAFKILGLEKKVGLLKLGTTWPLPHDLIIKHVSHADKIIFFEETDSFLEQNVTSLLAQHGSKTYKFFGQASGHVECDMGVGLGEMTPDNAVLGLAKVLNIENPLYNPHTSVVTGVIEDTLPERDLTMCPGCPHRSSFWAIQTALELDGRNGFVLGDIGCYTLGAFRAGNYILRSALCMGSGIGLANGFGQLHRFGFNQPVVALAGDSTFFHSCLPALVNAMYNNADFTLIILDNKTTAMTGFQPHPGTGLTARGEETVSITIDGITRAMGIKTMIADPHQLNDVVEILYGLFKEKGPKVLVLQKPCALRESHLKDRFFQVDHEKCIGDSCGCSRFCSRAFGCPAIFFDHELEKAYINDSLCNGCGACVDLCPRGAIFEKDGERNGGEQHERK